MSGIGKRLVQKCASLQKSTQARSALSVSVMRSFQEPAVAKEQLARIMTSLQKQISERKAHFLLRRREERLNQILDVQSRDSYRTAYATLREDLHELEKVDQELVQAQAKYQHDSVEYREIVRQDQNRRSGKYRGEPQIDCQKEMSNLHAELQSSRQHFERACEKRMEVDQALQQSLKRCSRLPGSIYKGKQTIYTLFG